MSTNEVYLIRFRDGPLSQVRMNAPMGEAMIPRSLFGWPLPKHLGILTHEGAANVAFWDVDSESGLPELITKSPNAVFYTKVAESQLPDDSMEFIVRGAVYAVAP